MIQYNNFLMKREQSRAGSRFAECEKSRLKAKILITLALLLTAVTGAWAQSYEAKVFDVPASWEEDNTHISAADLPKDFVQITKDEAKALAVPDGDVVLVYGFVGENVLMMAFDNGTAIPNDVEDGAPVARGNFIMFQTMAKVCYTTPAGPKVAWNASTKTGTFSMPGSDVVLTPQYAPAAQLAEGGAPAAVSGLEIAADAAIITAGQSAQGTLLYAVGTSQTEKPALTDFAATLPNAKDQTAAGNYYVWYYIQGQDTPQGQEPTAENTFNDSEIMGPVIVELLTNEHTLNIKQSPNITVTVAGTAVTPTDDKVTPVTTGQEVKIKAKEGYKFRKVEVKKGAAEKPVTLATALEDGATLEVMCQSSQSGNGLQMGGNFTNNNGEFTRNNFVGTSNVFSVMKATATISGTTITFATGFTSNVNYDHNVTLNTTDNTYTLTGGSNKGSVVSVKVNGVEILDKLSELK